MRQNSASCDQSIVFSHTVQYLKLTSHETMRLTIRYELSVTFVGL